MIALFLLINVDARVTKVSGKVEAAAAGGAYAAVPVGTTIAEGGRVRTGEKSEAVLQMSDGSQVKLSERGEMLVAAIKQTETAKTSVVLFFGRLWAKVAKAATPSASFEVVTPTAVAGVRGTEFTTAAGEDGNTRVQVDEGSVGVDNDSKDVSVGAGQAADANADAVGQPKKEAAPDWNKWQRDRRDNLQKNGETLARGAKARVEAKHREIARLNAEQKKLKERYKAAPEDERAGITKQLQKNATRLQELGVRAEGQFGQFEHWGELADDPSFGDSFIGSGFVRSELKRMRALHREFQEMIAEGTDLSMKGMEKMIDDMRDNRQTLPDRNKKGSVDDMFNEGK